MGMDKRRKNGVEIFGAVVFLITVLAPFELWAGPRRLIVPDQYKSIKAAIADASAGDTVFIKAGVYNEAIDFKDGINLIGEGAEKVKI